MIITRTPLRISFVGGGTDLPEYYLNANQPGRVFSSTIDKYVYVMLNRKFDGKVRVSYSETENVDSVKTLKHDIVRNTMEHFGQDHGWEIVTVADVPGVGSGLGSSSALTVGLLKAFSVALDEYYDPYRLAETAYMIERSRCHHYCGKQDQYAAAFGGMRLYTFFNDESVEHVSHYNAKISRLINDSLQLFYIGPRKDKTILKRQADDTHRNMIVLDNMSGLAEECFEEIEQYPCELGQYLDVNWEYKRKLAIGISDEKIQGYYRTAMEAGANGGKVLGQGGGGFMLFHANQDYHQAIRNRLKLAEVPFRLVDHGVEVIYAG